MQLEVVNIGEKGTRGLLTGMLILKNSAICDVLSMIHYY